MCYLFHDGISKIPKYRQCHMNQVIIHQRWVPNLHLIMHIILSFSDHSYSILNHGITQSNVTINITIWWWTSLSWIALALKNKQITDQIPQSVGQHVDHPITNVNIKQISQYANGSVNKCTRAIKYSQWCAIIVRYKNYFLNILCSKMKRMS